MIRRHARRRRLTEAERIASYARTPKREAAVTVAIQKTEETETARPRPPKHRTSEKRKAEKRTPEPAARQEVTLTYRPRPHQELARDAILDARTAGRSGYLLGDETGVGKTLPTWLAVAAMPERHVLVVCPPGAAPQWRRTVFGSGEAPFPKAVKITTYDAMRRLLRRHVPSRRLSGPRSATLDHVHNTPLLRGWPIVVLDECHRIRNPSSLRSILCRRLAEQAEFVAYVSATAGERPAHLHYLSRLMAEALGLGPLDRSLQEVYQAIGIRPEQGDPALWNARPRQAEKEAIARLLFTGDRPVGMRRSPGDIDGWPEVQRELAPTALSEEERADYQEAWRAYGAALGELRAEAAQLDAAGRRRDAGRSELSRMGRDATFRRMTSALRVNGTCDFVEDLLGNDLQVAVSAAFLDTSTAIESVLRERGHKVGRIDGRQRPKENEAVRVAFQSGEIDAVVFLATESISLHEGEMPGGDRKRALVIHDMRRSAIEMKQIEGRTHRDGRSSTVYYAYAEGTIEEEIAAATIDKMRTMGGMAGDDTDLLDAMAAAIGGRMKREGITR